MISLVVPTRNRANTLRLVADSFYRQDGVTELVFVDDAGEDDTWAVIESFARKYPDRTTRILRNETRMGAARSRILGYTAAGNHYVLYCDDDIHLSPGYAATCLRKLKETGAGAVSGRLLYKLPDETPEQAVQRFGNGLDDIAPFNRYVCELRDRARFAADLTMPLTHSVILTRKDLLERFSYDPFYARGNGFREESDYQMNLFVNGYDILVTNEVHCIHLSRAESRSGGHRINRFSRLYWNIYHTDYFYRKYYNDYAKRVGLRLRRIPALMLFAAYQVYALFLKPFVKVLREPRRYLRA